MLCQRLLRLIHAVDDRRPPALRRHHVDRDWTDPRLGIVLSTCSPCWRAGGPRDTGWSEAWVIGGLSLGLLISGLVSPRVGRLIERFGGRPVLAASAVLLAIGLLVLAFAPNLADLHDRAGW